MNLIRRLERFLTVQQFTRLPEGAYVPDKSRSSREWLNKGSGHVALAVSEGGHIMLSGANRRLILCGIKIQNMESSTARSIPNKDGSSRLGYTVQWKVHLPISTSLKNLLKPSIGITCQTCRDLLESIDDKLTE